MTIRYHTIEKFELHDAVSKNLIYFKDRLSPKSALQLVRNLKREKDYPGGIQVQSLVGWMSQLVGV